MENMKKQNFFKKAYNAITNFESYKEFYLEAGFKPISYLIKLSLILSLIISIFFVYKLSEEIKNFLFNEFPNFQYENGILNFEDTVNIEQDNNLFIIDTSIESEQGLEKYKESIELMTIPYSEIYEKNFSKENILNFYNSNKYTQIYFLICLICFPIIFVVYLLKYLIYILILSLFGILSTRILRMNLNYGSIFNLCVYGYTLSFILEIVFYIIELFTGFHVYRFDMISLLIAYVYLITALRIIKNDFIKRQEEYAKLNMETSVGTDSLNDEK